MKPAACATRTCWREEVALGRERPLGRGDRRRQGQEPGLAFQSRGPAAGLGSSKAAFKQKEYGRSLGRPPARPRTKAKCYRAAALRGSIGQKRQKPPGSSKSKLPDFVALSLATLYDKAPSGADWLHEIKFDGYRMEARLEAARCNC